MRPLAVSVVLGVLASACSSSSDDDPADCGLVPDPGDPVDGALVLGTGGPSDFAAVPDGSRMELAMGPQGGWMITPTLAADRAVLGGDGICVFVAVDVDLGAVDPPAHYEAIVPEVADADGRWYTEPLFVLLAFDLAAVDGHTAQVTSSYQDDGMVTASQLTVTLQNLVD